MPNCTTCPPTTSGCSPRNPCPSYPDAQCVVYTGPALTCSGITTNMRLNTALQKLDAKLCTTTIGNDLTYYTSDFLTTTECYDSNLAGKRYRLMWRGLGKLIKDVDWEPIQAGGFRILIAGFDVTLDENNTFFVEFY